jgi:hypothetical protein
MPNLRRLKLDKPSIVQDLRTLSLVAPQLTSIEFRPRSTFDGFGPVFELKERRLSYLTNSWYVLYVLTVIFGSHLVHFPVSG